MRVSLDLLNLHELADSIEQRDRADDGNAEIEHRLSAIFHAFERVAFIRSLHREQFSLSQSAVVPGRRSSRLP
jgi:hypothetical protein